MVYIYDACDQISDICHQQLKCDEKYLGRTQGQTDRGKTVYPPPPSGSGGIIKSKICPGNVCLTWRVMLMIRKCGSLNLGAIFCYITTKMVELEQEITLIGDSGNPQITMWVYNISKFI